MSEEDMPDEASTCISTRNMPFYSITVTSFQLNCHITLQIYLHGTCGYGNIWSVKRVTLNGIPKVLKPRFFFAKSMQYIKFNILKHNQFHFSLCTWKSWLPTRELNLGQAGIIIIILPGISTRRAILTLHMYNKKIELVCVLVC